MNFNNEQIKIITKFMNFFINKTKDADCIFSHIFRLSELFTIELINIRTKNIHKELEHRRIANRIVVYYLKPAIMHFDEKFDDIKKKKSMVNYILNYSNRIYGKIKSLFFT